MNRPITSSMAGKLISTPISVSVNMHNNMHRKPLKYIISLVTLRSFQEGSVFLSSIFMINFASNSITILVIPSPINFTLFLDRNQLIVAASTLLNESVSCKQTSTITCSTNKTYTPIYRFMLKRTLIFNFSRR